MSIHIRTRQFVRFLEKAWRKGAQLGPPKGKCSFCCTPYPKAGPLAQGPMGDLICFDCAIATHGIIADEIDKLDAASATSQLISEGQRRRAAILQVAEATCVNAKSFPQTLAMLVSAGVNSYFVDYASMLISYYIGGEAYSGLMPYKEMPPIADDLIVDQLRTAIADRQRLGQSHETFSRRAMEAGVFGYFVFLDGRRVTYLGQRGDQHPEELPEDMWNAM